MDGLAVVVTGSICYQSIILTYLLNQNKLTDLSVVLFFVILGFFIYNFPPAKLYLGDSGSLFIGFCLGFLKYFIYMEQWSRIYFKLYTKSFNIILHYSFIDFLIILEGKI